MSDLYFNPDGEITFGKGGNLPHWQQDGKLQWVTFRLGDSLPQEVLKEMDRIKKMWLEQHPQPWDNRTTVEYRKNIDEKINKWLDAGYGSCLLRDRAVAKILESVLLFDHLKKYEIPDYVIMPNHVHILMWIYDDEDFSKIMKQIKGISARRINLKLNRSGPLWGQESYDRLVRNPRHYQGLEEYIKKNILQGGVLWFDKTKHQ